MQRAKWFFVLTVFLTLSCVDPHERNLKFTNMARSALYAGQLDQAEEALNKALDYDSSNVETYLLYSQLLIAGKQYRDALSFVDRAVGLDTNNGEAYKARALLYQIMGNRDKACRDFKAAERLGVPNLDNYLKMCH